MKISKARPARRGELEAEQRGGAERRPGIAAADLTERGERHEPRPEAWWSDPAWRRSGRCSPRTACRRWWWPDRAPSPGSASAPTPGREGDAPERRGVEELRPRHQLQPGDGRPVAVAVPAKRMARLLPQRASMGTAARVAAAPSPSAITDQRVPPADPTSVETTAAVLEVGDALVRRRQRRAPLQRLDHRRGHGGAIHRRRRAGRASGGAVSAAGSASGMEQGRRRARPACGAGARRRLRAGRRQRRVGHGRRRRPRPSASVSGRPRCRRRVVTGASTGRVRRAGGRTGAPGWRPAGARRPSRPRVRCRPRDVHRPGRTATAPAHTRIPRPQRG